MPKFEDKSIKKQLRFQAATAGGLGSIPGQGARFHMLQLKLSGDKQKKLKENQEKPFLLVVELLD